MGGNIKNTTVGICKIHLKIPGKFDKINILKNYWKKCVVDVRALRSIEPDKIVRYIHTSEARGLSAEHKYGYSREPFSLDVFSLYV